MNYDRTLEQLSQASASQNKSANTDAVLVGVGAILFWPALLALPATGGGKEQEAQIARLKGQKDTLEQVMLDRNCPANVRPASPVPAITSNQAPQSLQ